MNKHVMSRLEGLRRSLMGNYEANSSMSSASKGREREEVLNGFLSKVLPLPYRFGSGDITDVEGRRSGQVDIVVEYPFLPSVPSIGGDLRLYLAESVAAVVEVKSDVSGQWLEVEQTSRNVKMLKRELGKFARDMYGGTLEVSPEKKSMLLSGMDLSSRDATPDATAIIEFTPDGVKLLGREVSPKLPIPVFVVSYKGWSTVETVKKHVAESGIDGVLILDHGGVFVSNRRFDGMTVSGPPALWAFISCLHTATKELSNISTNPLSYALEE